MTKPLKLRGVPVYAFDTVIVVECAPDQGNGDQEKPPSVAARSFLFPPLPTDRLPLI